MTKPAPADDVPVRRIDRILAFMSLGLLVLSVVCFFSIMIATATGATPESFSSGIWPLVSMLTLVAPIAAFAMLFAVLIMTFIRKARANKGR